MDEESEGMGNGANEDDEAEEEEEEEVQAASAAPSTLKRKFSRILSAHRYHGCFSTGIVKTLATAAM